MDEAFAHVGTNGIKSVKKGTIPPDGGWGYLISVGVGFTFMLGFGSSNAFGILFHNFFMEQNSGTGLPLVIGVYNGALSIAGFLGGIALKKYSFRQVGLVGAGLFILGDVLTIFVQTTSHLVFTFGVIRGAGFGVMIPVSLTAFNCYFTKKRVTMMSANQSMSSLASITFPMLVTFLLSEYGFRWTLAIIMAMDLHLLFAMLVMHPVEWHLIKINEAELESAIKCDVFNGKLTHFEAYDESIVKMLPDGDKEINDDSIKVKKKISVPKSVLKNIYNNVELDLLKDPRFVSVLMGLGFAFVSDVTYLAMEPMLLFSYGFSKIQVATCVMVGAIADLCARIGLAIFTYFYSVDSKLLFFIGTTVTIFLRIALVSCSEIWFVFTITVISGLVRCTVQVLFPLVLATAAPESRFPAALSLHIILSGTLMLITDPLIGVLYEVTGSFSFCFFAMSFCCLICVVLWTIEYFVYRATNT